MAVLWPAAAQDPRPQPQAKPLRQLQVDHAKLLKRVVPVYPKAAKGIDVEGQVRVSILVGKNGRVKEAEALSGHPLLQHSALEAIQQCEYERILLNEKPIEFSTSAIIIFKLGSKLGG